VKILSILLALTLAATPAYALTPKERKVVQKALTDLREAKREYADAQAKLALADERAVQAEQNAADAWGHATVTYEKALTLSKQIDTAHKNEQTMANAVAKMKPVYDKCMRWFGVGAILFGFGMLFKHTLIAAAVLLVLAAILWFAVPLARPILRVPLPPCGGCLSERNPMPDNPSLPEVVQSQAHVETPPPATGIKAVVKHLRDWLEAYFWFATRPALDHLRCEVRLLPHRPPADGERGLHRGYGRPLCRRDSCHLPPLGHEEQTSFWMTKEEAIAKPADAHDPVSHQGRLRDHLHLSADALRHAIRILVAALLAAWLQGCDTKPVMAPPPPVTPYEEVHLDPLPSVPRPADEPGVIPADPDPGSFELSRRQFLRRLRRQSLRALRCWSRKRSCRYSLCHLSRCFRRRATS
jgi:hypothetical protein